ncbi:hypothetical protein BS50DRAFT_587924 [Corynespora cassiicola Philippines]|uniref:Uncharacterized protein n=1 Tax=Corynespora cassiicola Philippines TaxID=1448308 RepID=A0A2T2NN58_CORCC|nr:hypothetical protein BS50DRAFT_587924 [Corynespora cassiicola Philippines]
MAFSRRLDVSDLDVALPDDELPDYDAAAAPAYRPEDYDVPLQTYHLRQINRKLQIFVPLGPLPSPSYKVRYNGASRIFSKKPQMELVRCQYANAVEDGAASLCFVNDGPLPWRPRAQFTHFEPGGPKTHAMESRNFSDWTVAFEGTNYVWALEARPISLALSEKATGLVVARFIYSARGTLAKDGAEVGELVIYPDVLSLTMQGVERILGGLLVAVAHMKNMGRHYWNENGPARANSLPREPLAMNNRAASVSYSNV